MHHLKFVLLTAVFATIALLLSSNDAAAAEVEFSYPDSLYGATADTEVPLSVTVTLANEDPPLPSGEPMFGFGINQSGMSSPLYFTNGTATGQWNPSINTKGISQCIAQGYITVSGQVYSSPSVGINDSFEVNIPCSVNIAPAFVPIASIDVCGSNNDTIAGLDAQPVGVVVDPGAWVNNQRTVTLAESPGAVWTNATSPQISSYTDMAIPCISGIPVSPTQTAICGSDNDGINPQDQPEGVDSAPTDTGWLGDQRTNTYSPENDYVFPEGSTGVFSFTDNGPCITDAPIPPIQTEVCGPNNDVVLLGEQPTNVLVDDDGVWAEGTWDITFTAAENFALPANAVAVFNLVDSNTPCPTDAPVSPVQTAICGPDNDLLTFPEQPEGVTLDSDTEWGDNTRTGPFAVAEEFITDGPAAFVFTDDNIDCPPVGVTVTVLFETSDSGSITGTAWTLDAPMASQAASAPFAEGVIGAGNEIVLEALMPGDYRLVASPVGYEQIDSVLTVTSETDEIVIAVVAVPIPVTPTVTATSVPTETPTTAAVTSLPETGSGPGNSVMIFGIAGLLAAAVIGLGVGGRIRDDNCG